MTSYHEDELDYDLNSIDYNDDEYITLTSIPTSVWVIVGAFTFMVVAATGWIGWHDLARLVR